MPGFVRPCALPDPFGKMCKVYTIIDLHDQLSLNGKLGMLAEDYSDDESGLPSSVQVALLDDGKIHTVPVRTLFYPSVCPTCADEISTSGCFACGFGLSAGPAGASSPR